MSWRRFLRRRRWDRERARELQAYLDFEIDEGVAWGLSHDEARRAAHLKLGNPYSIREEIYRMNTVGFIESVWQDLRHGARLLRLNPGFACVAILSLALGIGANTAIFQLLDAVRMRMLPVKEPQRLAEIGFPENSNRAGRFASGRPMLTNAQWELIRANHEPFAGAMAWSEGTFNLAPRGETRYVQGLWVSGEFFDVLGVEPLLGRLIGAADDRKGCGTAGAVISYPFWQREYGGDVAAIGRKLAIEGKPFEVIGVTPESFFGVDVGRSFDIAIPICSEAAVAGANGNYNDRMSWWLASFGRLKPGWTVERATAWLRTISPGLFQATLPPGYRPEDAKNYLELKLMATAAGDGVSALRTRYLSPLWILLGIAGFVLLIACANLANLMLARASAREREMAVRLAVGAGRGRLARQLLAESLLLSGAGAVLGIALARVMSRALLSFLSTDGNIRVLDLALDWRVLGFTAGLAILTCVVFGLAPAVRATNTEPGVVMKSSGRGLTTNRERFSLRRILVVSQVALSLVLLAAGLMFVRSLRNLLTVDMGFRQEGLLSVAAEDPERSDLTPERRRAFHRDLLARLRATPGVTAVAVSNIVPVSGMFWNEYIDVAGQASSEHGKSLSNFSSISMDYFKTLEVPLLAGRDFNEYDTPSSQRVAIVNQTFARQFLHGANPVGATFTTEVEPGKPEPRYQIVGLTRDTKYGEVREDFTPIAYVAMSQEEGVGRRQQILIQSRGPEEASIPAIKRAVLGFEPGIKLTVTVVRRMIRDTLTQERLMATLSGFFGVLAAVLATIGLYGVISYMVARRRNEIGIRLALGAEPGAVVVLVIREAGTLLAVGLAIGTGAALAAGTVAQSMLYGLRPQDPATIAMAVGILGTVALLASYLPARRASRLDPVAALREE